MTIPSCKAAVSIYWFAFVCVILLPLFRNQNPGKKFCPPFSPADSNGPETFEVVSAPASPSSAVCLQHGRLVMGQDGNLPTKVGMVLLVIIPMVTGILQPSMFLRHHMFQDTQNLDQATHLKPYLSSFCHPILEESSRLSQATVLACPLPNHFGARRHLHHPPKEK